jgi:hypothetical protein
VEITDILEEHAGFLLGLLFSHEDGGCIVF